MMFGLFVVLAIGAIQTYAQAVPCSVTANTESGVVCGTVMKDTDGDEYASFQGIPYAKAPYGRLRFAAPQKREPFEGVFNATVPGAICPQRPSALARSGPTTVMDEDCLNLNIFVPRCSFPNNDASTAPLLPVMVFVHGGSFAFGSTKPYGPENLMTEGIILVTLHYRLNAFGFLNLGTKEIPGNTGMRDVVFALKWIQDNIRNFGGDPAEVTLSGHSAGGGLVGLISLSPAVEGLGLFKRVITLSGSALYNGFTISPEFSRTVTKIFLLGMGIDDCQNKEEIFEELINAPVQRILKANAFVREVTGLSVTFSPVIETPQKGLESMIPKDPEDLLNEGYGKEHTTLLGFTDSECDLYRDSYVRDNFLGRFKRQPFLIVPQNLFYSSNILTRMILTDAILNQYFNNSEVTIDEYMNFCNDVNFVYPAMRLARKRLEIDAEPTFVYQFSYRSQRSAVPSSLKIKSSGVIHIEDISYIFRLDGFDGPNELDELGQANDDSRVQRWMTRSIANFVKTGNPTVVVEWPPSGPNLFIMNIEVASKLESGPATPLIVTVNDFFDNLYNIVRGD